MSTSQQGKPGEPGKNAQGSIGGAGGTGGAGGEGEEQGGTGGQGGAGGAGGLVTAAAGRRWLSVGYIILAIAIVAGLAFAFRQTTSVSKADRELCRAQVRSAELQVEFLQTRVDDARMFARYSTSPEIRAYMEQALPAREKRFEDSKAIVHSLKDCRL